MHKKGQVVYWLMTHLTPDVRVIPCIVQMTTMNSNGILLVKTVDGSYNGGRDFSVWKDQCFSSIEELKESCTKKAHNLIQNEYIALDRVFNACKEIEP